jgi:hypothetical protein
MYGFHSSFRFKVNSQFYLPPRTHRVKAELLLAKAQIAPELKTTVQPPAGEFTSVVDDQKYEFDDGSDSGK